MATTVTLVVKRIDELGKMRRRLRRLLIDHDVVERLVTDVAIAATELATNGLVHGGAPAVAVRVTASQRQVDLCVHHADGQPSLQHPVAVPDTDAGGRGLAIVSELSDEIAVEQHPGWRSTQLEFDRRSVLPAAAAASTVTPIRRPAPVRRPLPAPAAARARTALRATSGRAAREATTSPALVSIGAAAN